MKKSVRNKKARWLIIISVLVVIFISIILFIIQSSLFDPLHKSKLAKVKLSRYKDGTYHELTISDAESLETLYAMRNSIIKKATIVNSKLRDSEAFQKDSEYIAEYIWKNGEHQTIELNGNNVIVFNYCPQNEYPKLFLDNNSSGYDISFSKDALADYILWLYYINQ